MKWILDFLFGRKPQTKKQAPKKEVKKNSTVKNKQPKQKVTSQVNLTHEMLENEEWRPVVNFEGYYEVSSLGRLRSVDRVIECVHPIYGKKSYVKKGCMINQKRMHGGHPSAQFRTKSKTASYQIKRLVADAFLGYKPGAYYEIKNINGNRFDVRASNLKCTKKRIRSRRVRGEQEQPEVTVQPMQAVQTVNNVNAKTSNTQRISNHAISKAERKMIEELRKVGYTYLQIVKQTGRSRATVARILRQSKNKKSSKTEPIQLRIL
jgi:hypothetical protein